MCRTGLKPPSDAIVSALFSAFFSTLCATVASAQAAPPPFFGGGTAYDPQVSTLNSGALLYAQPVVSADQQSVSLNVRASDTQLRSLARFPVVNIHLPGGFVGGATLPGETGSSGAPARDGTLTPPAAGVSPEAISRAAKSWILSRQGMFFVAAVK